MPGDPQWEVPWPARLEAESWSPERAELAMAFIAVHLLAFRAKIPAVLLRGAIDTVVPMTALRRLRVRRRQTIVARAHRTVG